ncbi:MAG TPA: sugar transferase [Acidimicrobiales bacterium]|nr:sugar transferase [Acidimicrobiales bacterium]
MSSVTVDDARFVGVDLLDASDRGPREIVSARRKAHARALRRTLLSDFVALAVAFGVGIAVLGLISTAPGHSLSRFSTNFIDDLSFVIAAFFAFSLYGLYRQDRRRLVVAAHFDLGRLLHAVVASALMAVVVAAVLQHFFNRPSLDVLPLLVIALVTFLSVPMFRAIARRVGVRTSGPRMRVLIVGSGMMANRIQRSFAQASEVEVVGLVDDDPVPGTDVAGRVADIPRLCGDLGVDRVLVGFSKTHPSEAVDLLRDLHGKIPISIVPRYFELLSWRSQVDDLCGLPVIDVAPPTLGLQARFMKRSVDVVVSCVCLLVAFPLLVTSAMLIKLTSPGPVFFRQPRSGRDGKAFDVLKLRTMKVDAERERDVLRKSRNDVDGPIFKLRDDPRVFPFGRFLRRTSIDELPQLFNVLKGEMSLVGPRPFPVDESEEIDGWAARRFEVRPGITGLWQVSGRSELSFDELCRLDYLYVASWSLLWDLRILWQTPSAVMNGSGAY